MYSKVYVEITNVCNMNCSFCHGHHRSPRQMSEDEFALILDKLKPHTQYIYYHLMGEPLTHPLLPRFVEMAGTQGYKSIITTNGTLLHKCGDELISAGLHKVNLSVHSFEGDEGEAFDGYLRQLAQFADAASRAGVIVVFRLWNKGFDHGKNSRVLQLLQELLPGDWAENTRGLRIRDKLFVELGDRFEWPDSKAEIKGDRFYCYALKDQFGILADGSVVPCCLDSEGGITLGNVFSEDLDAILCSPRAEAMVEGFKCGTASEELCKRCGYAQRFIKR